MVKGNVRRMMVLSPNPLEAIDKVAYLNQPAHLRMYVSGFEKFVEEMPYPEPDNAKELLARMTELASAVGMSDFSKADLPNPQGFNRTIIAIEEPGEEDGKVIPGIEVFVAKWGDGFETPIHGHSQGYMNEQVISGRIVECEFRIVDAEKWIVRPVEMKIHEAGEVITSEFRKDAEGDSFGRKHLVHFIRSVGQSVTIHFVTEHSRDGRGNRFKAEYFDDKFQWGENDFTRISMEEAMKLKTGDVALVRSKNVPELKDHYIVITGDTPVQKRWGLRLPDIAIPAPTNVLLNLHDRDEPVTILLLNERARNAFYEFHAIEMVEGSLQLPKW